MTASDKPWAVAAILLTVLAVVLASRVGAREQDVREVRERIVSLQETADRLGPDRVSVGRNGDAQAAAVTEETLPRPSAARKRVAYPDEIEIGDPEERGRARRVAMKKMYADPETRALIIAEGIEMHRSYYSGLAQALQLSPEEEDQLLQTMTNREIASWETIEDDQTVSMTDYEARQQLINAEVRGQLGAAKFKAFERYRETSGERSEVQRFRQALGEGEDLTTEAAERMIDALAQERARLQAEQAGRSKPTSDRFEMYLGAGRGVTVESPGEESALSDARKQLEEQDRRLETATEPILNGAQRKVYAEFLRERRDARLEMVESMLREQKAGAQSD